MPTLPANKVPPEVRFQLHDTTKSAWAASHKTDDSFAGLIDTSDWNIYLVPVFDITDNVADDQFGRRFGQPVSKQDVINRYGNNYVAAPKLDINNQGFVHKTAAIINKVTPANSLGFGLNAGSGPRSNGKLLVASGLNYRHASGGWTLDNPTPEEQAEFDQSDKRYLPEAWRNALFEFLFNELPLMGDWKIDGRKLADR